MDTRKKMAFEATPTAPKARAVPFRKQTVLPCPKSEGRTSEFSHEGGKQ